MLSIKVTSSCFILTFDEFNINILFYYYKKKLVFIFQLMSNIIITISQINVLNKIILLLQQADKCLMVS